MKIIASIIIVAIIALVVGFVPIVEVPYTETVQYQDTETYYEDVPYADTEVYYEREPYEVTETYYEDEPYEITETYAGTWELAHKVIDVRTETLFSHTETQKVPFEEDKIIEYFNPVAVIELQNIDTVKGTFKAQFTWYWMMTASYERYARDYPERTKDEILRELGTMGVVKVEGDKRIYSEDQVELYPGTIGTVRSHNRDIRFYAGQDEEKKPVWVWDYVIVSREMLERSITKHRQVQKEKTVTEYREVEKERPVTKYRQVEKERTVTKERLETHYKKVPIFEYLLSRF